MLGVFVDTETTGLDPFVHVPIEIAIVIVDLVTGKEFGAYETLLSVTPSEWDGRDLQSAVIHGRTLPQLQEGVSRSDAAIAIESLLSSCQITNDRAFFICQNPSFDRPFFSRLIPQYRQESLGWPYHWLDLASMYWALRGAEAQRKHTFGVRVSKDAIAAVLGLPPEQKPHRAINGVRHLILCYERLVGFRMV